MLPCQSVTATGPNIKRGCVWMLKSYMDVISRDRIAGWALDPEHPEQDFVVRVVVDGHEVVRGVADRSRPDLARTYGNGDHGFDLRIDPPLSAQRTHYISVRVDPGNIVINDNIIVGSNGNLGLSNKIQPVVLSSTGRSGTTIMMQTLGDNKSIVVAGNYPYEIKLMTHYAHAIKVLSAPSFGKNAVDPGKIHSDKLKIGSNPFFNDKFSDTFSENGKLYDILGRYSTARLSAAFGDIVQEFYEELRREKNKTESVYFLEKCDILTQSRNYIKMQFESFKEILLVRDLRDVYCSSKSFWSAGDEFLTNIVDAKNVFIGILNNLDENTIIVKYEDFILDKQKSLAAISRFLGIECVGAAGGGGDAVLFGRHATSSSPEHSIGRWKTDLSDVERSAFRERLGDFVEAFGYERDSAG